MKQFRLYDYYEEERENLGEFETMQEVKKACKERNLETDGECSFVLFKLNPESGKYKKLEKW